VELTLPAEFLESKPALIVKRAEGSSPPRPLLVPAV
jgi:hypothetical protein